MHNMIAWRRVEAKWKIGDEKGNSSGQCSDLNQKRTWHSHRWGILGHGAKMLGTPTHCISSRHFAAQGTKKKVPLAANGFASKLPQGEIGYFGRYCGGGAALGSRSPWYVLCVLINNWSVCNPNRSSLCFHFWTWVWSCRMHFQISISRFQPISIARLLETVPHRPNQGLATSHIRPK